MLIASTTSIETDSARAKTIFDGLETISVRSLPTSYTFLKYDLDRVGLFVKSTFSCCFFRDSFEETMKGKKQIEQLRMIRWMNSKWHNCRRFCFQTFHVAFEALDQLRQAHQADEGL